MNYLASGINVVSVNPGALVVSANILCAGSIVAASISGNVGNSSLPGVISADLVGNVTGTKATLSGNATAAYFIGNGALLTGISASNSAALPSTIAADIVGNLRGNTVTLSGNVNAANVNAGLVVTGLTFSNTYVAGDPGSVDYFWRDTDGLLSTADVLLTGNANAEYLKGNAVVVSGNATASYFKGNAVVVSGNATASYFKGNGALLTGIANALPKTITADLVGNANAWTVRTWALSVGYDNLIANVLGAFTHGLYNTGGPIFSDGFVAGNTSFTDYSWNQTDGVLRTKAVTLTGNATAAYFKGNGSLLTGISVSNSTLPSTIAADIVGNLTGAAVTLTGNATASYLFGSVVAPLAVCMNVSTLSLVAGSTFVANSKGAFTSDVAATGNATAAYFKGNGALLTGIAVANAGLPKTIAADVVGNLTGDNITLVGNIEAFVCNADVALMGLTYSEQYVAGVPGASIDHSWLANGLLTTTELRLTGNATAAYFKGNGALLTGVGNSTLPKTIAADIVGNLTGNTVTLSGNVNAANVNAGLVVTGLAYSKTIVAGAPGSFDYFWRDTDGLLSTAGLTATGNATAAYFKGNGALLTGITVANAGLPKTIKADVVGNLTGDSIMLTGNIESSVCNADVALMGLVYSEEYVVGIPGSSVDHYWLANGLLTTTDLLLTGNARASNFNGNAVVLSGNATASYFKGNGALLTGIANALPKTITADLVGNANAWTVRTWALNVGYDNLAANVGGAYTKGLFNTGPIYSDSIVTGNTSFTNYSWSSSTGLLKTKDVTLTGNATAAYFVGNGALLTGIGLPKTIVADVFGNLEGTSISMIGNLYGESVDVTRGVYADSFEGNTALFNEVDVNGNVSVFADSYFLGNGALLTGLTLENIAIPDTIAGNNAVLRGYTRSEVYYGNSVNVWNLSGNNVHAAGTFSGNGATLSGNVAASYFLGNGALLTGIVTALGNTISADIVGNLAGNGALLTGNVAASYFLGNGALLTGIVTTLGNTISADIVGNLAGNSAALSGNVAAAYFEGNGALLTGIVTSIGNTVHADVVGNLSGSDATLSGNATAAYFLGNGALLTGIVTAPLGVISDDLVGNVVGDHGTFGGNVTAAHFAGNGALLTGLVVGNASLPRTIAADLEGNVSGNAGAFAGNVAAWYFSGNGSLLSGIFVGNAGLPKTIAADLAGNVVGNSASFEGNVTALRFIGNGALLTGVPAGNVLLVDTLVLGNLTTTANVNAERVSANAVTVRGNVVSAANVDAERMTANVLTVRGNVNSSGWMTVAGNVTATNFVGSGALLTGLTSGACFVTPSTGITSNIAGAVAYSAATGWTISLQQSTPTWVTISAYSMPMTPDAPLMGVPASVTQVMTTPFAFAPATGLWTGTVRLTALSLFDPVNASIGGSTAFGTFNGNSNAMQAVGVTLISVTGVRPSPRGGGNGYSGGSYIDPVTGSIAMNVYATANYTVTQWGQTLLGGNVYHIVTDKNLTAVSYINRVVGPVGGYGRTCKGAHYVSMTELYVAFAVNSANASVPVYDKTATSANATGGTAFVAKVNPVANTCSWWVSVTPNITGGWQQYPLLTVSPDGTKVAVAGGVLATTVTSVNMRRDGGGAATTYTYPRGNTLYYNGFTTFLYASNGVPVNGGVAMTCYQATPVGYQWETWQQTHAWSPDSAFFTMQVSTSEQAGQTWGYWNGTSMVDKTTFYSGFSPGAGTICATIIFPVGNLVSAPWGSERVTPSVLGKDAGYYGAAAWGGDGNLWTVMNTYKQVSTGETTTFTYGGSSLTTPSTALYNVGSLFIWRGRIDPATSAYAASSVASYKTTTTDASGIQALTGFESIALAPYPYANSSSMRMVFSTSQGTMTLGGVACTGLTINQSRAVTVDMTKDMTVSNFKTITGNTAYVTEFQSGQLLRGPASDSGYTLAVGATYGWKQSSTGGG